MRAGLLMAALAAASPSPPTGIGTDLSGVAVADQHGSPLAVADLRGKPAVVLVVTARRARLLKGWEKALLDTAASPPVMRVVEVPPRGKAREVARMLRKRAPAEVRVGVDAERVFAERLGLDFSEPHALVLDARGRVVARVRGRGRPQEAAAVRAALAGLAAAGGRP